MEARPEPWIRAIRHSQERLEGLVEPLDDAGLQSPSYDSEWSVAQVLSHLGSSAEIFGLLLEAGLSGSEPPGPEAFGPIWAFWNARTPGAQAADALETNDALLHRLESLDEADQARFHLHVFGMDIDTPAFARMRLSEHAVHTWDVAVALDPEATVSDDAVDLLVDTLPQVAARGGKPTGSTQRVLIVTSDPERRFVLAADEDSVTLGAASGEGGLRELRLPAEALLRLVYGRLDEGHTPRLQPGGAGLAELRPLFPGF